MQSPVLQDHATHCNSNGSGSKGSCNDNTRFNSSSNTITNISAGSSGDADMNSTAHSRV